MAITKSWLLNVLDGREGATSSHSTAAGKVLGAVEGEAAHKQRQRQHPQHEHHVEVGGAAPVVGRHPQPAVAVRHVDAQEVLHLAAAEVILVV